MPKAHPRSEPVSPFPLTEREVVFIKEAVERFYGKDAIVRNFGPEPNRLEIHVETSSVVGRERDDCLGVLMCRIERDQIDLTVTKRGTRVFGKAKIAYRQGTII